MDQRVLVLISMAAFLAAATQAPLTASVVVMEMTGSQPMLFWLLLGALSASLVSRQFCPQAFYHLAGSRFRRQAIVEAGRAAKGGVQRPPRRRPCHGRRAVAAQGANIPCDTIPLRTF